MTAWPHELAWQIPTDDGDDYGVLVALPHVGSAGRHWYLICPADATLYFEDSDGTVDLTDCVNGPACNFLDDTHLKAHELVKALKREVSS